MDLDLLELLDQVVTIEPWVSANSYGVPTYGTPVDYPARVSETVDRRLSAGGTEVKGKFDIWLDGSVTVSLKDKITLPAGFQPSNPPIMEVIQKTDGFGDVYYTKIRC